MLNKLAHVCIVVRDYDEAIQWYTEKLELELRSDNPFGNGYRWVTLGARHHTRILRLFFINQGLGKKIAEWHV
nr:VOC family protein [Marininema mesophilum]